MKKVIIFGGIALALIAVLIWFGKKIALHQLFMKLKKHSKLQLLKKL
jgi:HlyD family secretion protein